MRVETAEIIIIRIYIYIKAGKMEDITAVARVSLVEIRGRIQHVEGIDEEKRVPRLCFDSHVCAVSGDSCLRNEWRIC